MYNRISRPIWIFSITKLHSTLLITLSFLLSWVYSSPICPSGNCCPYYDAQTQQCYDVDPNNSNNMPSQHVSRNIPRGGSAATATMDSSSSSLSHKSDKDDYYEEIDYDSISLALRMTCELNRQLMYGTNGMTCAGGHTEQVDHIDFPDSSQTWFHSIQPPSSPSSNAESDTNAPSSLETLTIFHAKSPRTLSSSKKKRKLRLKTGCARWGPGLALYLRQLHTSLQCPPITFALALIYLDRACSAETQRNLSVGAMACPHLTPRTAHRLVLTAMVIASKAMDATPTTPTKDGKSDKYMNLLRTFGISEAALQNMETWMLQALGEKGTWVDTERMKNLWTVWQCAFSTTAADGDNNEEGGSKQFIGIGLQKELERLYPPVNKHVPEIQEIHPSMQQQQLHSQWQDSSHSNPRVVHIRREQHIVHVRRPVDDAPNNSYHNNEHPSASYAQPQQPSQEYAPLSSNQVQNGSMHTQNPTNIANHHPQHQQQQQQPHPQSDYLGPSGGYLREESDANLTEYYARA